MHFNDRIELITLKSLRDKYGQTVEKKQAKTVFANRYQIGEEDFNLARANGLHYSSRYAIYTAEYSGETLVGVDGVICDVLRTTQRGDFTIITIGEKLGAKTWKD